jgi:hypothetical protein
MSWQDFLTPQGIESVVTSVAIVIGGFWVLFTFGALQQRNKAAAELQKLRRELRAEIAVAVEIQARSMDPAQRSHCQLEGAVTLTNMGNEAVEVDVGSYCPLKLAKVDLQPGRSPAFALVGEDHLYRFGSRSALARPIRNIRLRPSVAVRYPFVAAVSEPGLYLVEFAIRIPEGQRPHLVDAADDPDAAEAKRPFSWAARTYVEVNAGAVAN